MQEIIEIIRKFNADRDWEQFHTPSNLAKSLVIEAGELLELFQWSEEVKSLDDLKDELADVLSYTLMIADHYNLDISEILKNKIAKNAKKYPIEKARGKSHKYHEYKKDK